MAHAHNGHDPRPAARAVDPFVLRLSRSPHAYRRAASTHSAASLVRSMPNRRCIPPAADVRRPKGTYRTRVGSVGDATLDLEAVLASRAPLVSSSVAIASRSRRALVPDRRSGGAGTPGSVLVSRSSLARRAALASRSSHSSGYATRSCLAAAECSDCCWDAGLLLPTFLCVRQWMVESTLRAPGSSAAIQGSWSPTMHGDDSTRTTEKSEACSCWTAAREHHPKERVHAARTPSRFGPN